MHDNEMHDNQMLPRCARALALLPLCTRAVVLLLLCAHTLVLLLRCARALVLLRMLEAAAWAHRRCSFIAEPAQSRVCQQEQPR